MSDDEFLPFSEDETYNPIVDTRHSATQTYKSVSLSGGKVEGVQTRSASKAITTDKTRVSVSHSEVSDTLLNDTVVPVMAESNIDDTISLAVKIEANKIREEQNDANRTQIKLNDSILKTHQDLANISAQQIELQREHNKSLAKSAKQKHLHNLLSQITNSDGLVVPELLSFCDTIDLAIKSSDYKLDNDHYLWLAKGASKGELHREIVEFLSSNESVAWSDVKIHIIQAFVGPNATDIFREQLDTFRQSPTETIPAFNRRFKSLANRAYPDKPSDIDRIVLKCYVKAIRDPNIITRLYNGLNNPNNFEEAMHMVEKIHSTISQLISLGVVIPQNQLEFDVLGDKKKSGEKYDKMSDRVNKQSTELEKCRIQLKQLQDRLTQYERHSQVIQAEHKTNDRPDYQRVQSGKNDSQYRIQGSNKGNHFSGKSVEMNDHQYARSNFARNNRSNSGWTDDGQPICYFCKEVGHIRRQCQFISPTQTKN